jgi:excisionase family DNA binding protein
MPLAPVRGDRLVAGPSDRRETGMTVEELRGLPVVIDLPTAARALNIGRTVAYRLVRTGDWPTSVLRLGRQIRIPTAEVRRLLER